MVFSSATNKSRIGLFSAVTHLISVVMAMGLSHQAMAQDQLFEDWLAELRAEAAIAALVKRH